MKHYLLIIFALFTVGILQAQNPNCEVMVWPVNYQNGVTTLAAFDSSSSQAISYQWSTGETTSEIDVSTNGVYCVTVTYADGCTATDCDTIDNSVCSSGAYSWVDFNGNQVLNAYHFPSYVDAYYEWSNGQTGNQIIVTQPGTYSVTVTLENGCSTVSTLTVVINPPTCDLYLYRQDSIETGSVWLYASMWPSAVTYEWSTGDSTSYLEVTQPGTYCVTATNSAGCTQSQCMTINCGVGIVTDSNGVWTATPIFGTPPFAYYWSDSSTTASITPNFAGYYCVTMIDATGCSSSDCGYYWGEVCQASVTYNPDNTLTANMSGTGPFTYSWQPGGLTTQTISPDQTGYYYVTVTNANGCQAWAGSYWYDLDDCHVDVFVYTDSTPVANSAWLYAQPPGNYYDWELNWSTGTSGNSIFVTVGGEYCVTATNLLNGCTATTCLWIQPDNACTAEISGVEIDPVTWELSVNAGPDPIAAYAWSTGETTPTAHASSAGYYTVTVTNTAGCTVSAYYRLFDNLASLLVRAELDDSTAFNSNGVHALIYLIEYDTAQGGILTAIDTAATYSWSDSWAMANLENVQPGNYLLKAALIPGSNGYDEYLPTYYESALLWSDATPYVIHALTNAPVQEVVVIEMTPGQNPGGPGFIGGLVSQGANLTGGGGTNGFGEGDPFAGASVVLTLPNGTPVAATVTNASGQYSFPNLPWGTYVLTLDIPGLGPVSITVTIGPDEPLANNINFKVDDNSIAVPTKEPVSGAPLKVFPNPAHDLLTVELPAAAELTLTNAQGQAVLRMQENGAIARLPLRDLPTGIYFLTARMANEMQVVKVMIE